MKLLHRGQAPESSTGLSAEQIVADTNKDNFDQAVTPEQFLSVNQELLERSTGLWGSIAKVADFASNKDILERLQSNMSTYNRPEFTTETKGGVIRTFVSHELSGLDASRLAAEAGILLLVGARYYAHTEGNFIKAGVRSAKELHLVPNPFVRKVLKETFPRTDIAKHSSDIVGNLGRADSVAKEVLGALVTELWQAPDFAQELIAYTKNGGSDSSLCQELSRIIAVDLRRPDDEQSILRAFLQEVRDRPDYYLDNFVKEVSENEKNRRYSQIRDMARFALIHDGVDTPDGVNIREALKNTFPRWKSFEQISEAFSEFSKASTGPTGSILSYIGWAYK